MLHIKKQITTGHNVVADCWKINGVDAIGNKNDEFYTASGNLNLLLNEASMLEYKTLLDNIVFVFNDLTEAEINGNTLGAIITRLMTPNVVDGIETNLFSTTHSGLVYFTDGTVVL